LAQESRDVFNEIVLPAILADCDDELPEQTQKEIAAGKRIDLRVPRFLSVSGKGGPGFEEWSNVTLFDHASSVGMAAATFAALDLLGGGHSPEETRPAVAVGFAVGLMHDIDKLLRLKWHEVTLEHVREIFERYRIGAFLQAFSVDLTAEQFAVLISFDETRSAYCLAGPRPPDRWINIVRRHVRLADVLDSHWLRGVPIQTVSKVLDEWDRATSKDGRFYNRSAFSGYKKLLLSDPHHPFLLAKFAGSLDDICAQMTGMRPLLHAVRDETLVSLIPEHDYADVVKAAIEETVEAIPFDSELLISRAGVPKIGGAKPSWSVLRQIVEHQTPTGGTARLLLVKAKDFRQHEAALRDLASQAGCPFVPTDKAPPGQTMPIVPSLQRDDADFAAVKRACLISLAVGVEEDSKVPEFSRKNREQRLVSILGGVFPDWLNGVDALTRRTALALITTTRMNQSPNFSREVENTFAAWFAGNGVFGGRQNKGSIIRDAVRDRFMALASGQPIDRPDALQACLVTAEPAGGAPIEEKDGLYGINSSALSYRPGRAEHKFREIAETYLSPVSQAEYRLRAAAFAKLRRIGGGIAVRLSSPTAGGIFSLAIGDMRDREFGLFDVVRANTAKHVYNGAEAYLSRTHLGRFESLPRHFADRSEGKGVLGRVTFFRVAMEAARRYGRPLHLFSGLPHARREFFYCDCLDPELRELLGSNGLRLEDLPEAMERLRLVGLIAGPQKSDGLGMPDVAKSFCFAATRFSAACLAWISARDRADENKRSGKSALGQLQADLNRYIEREVEKMDQENTVSPPVQLGRMAVSIQKRPVGDASARDETFLIDAAIEGATYAYRNGWRDRDGLVAQVAGRIEVDGARRAKGVKWFYSARANREPGQHIADAIEAFAEAFVDLAWFGAFKGRPPSSNDQRNFLAAYRWTFTRSAPKDTDLSDNSEMTSRS
jgi:hypothetical protein